MPKREAKRTYSSLEELTAALLPSKANISRQSDDATLEGLAEESLKLIQRAISQQPARARPKQI
jgi:hypothetical protein